MHTRIMSEDPVRGIRRVHHYDTATGLSHIETTQDVSAFIEGTKSLYNSVDERANWKGDWHRVGSIPLVIYFDLKKRGILDDDKALAKWMNDPDNRAFRTRPGRI